MTTTQTAQTETPKTEAAPKTDVEAQVETQKAKTAKAEKKPAAKSVSAIVGKAFAPIAYEPGIEAIELGAIEIPPEGNTTRPEGVSDVSDLVDSIAATGQQVPVIVMRTGKNTYKLAAGFRRMAALTILKAQTVQARVLAKSTEDQRVLANVTENENARLPISALGRLAGYEALAAKGFSVGEIARLTGRAEDFIRDHMRISKGADEVRAALAKGEDEEGTVTWAVARLVLRFPKAEQASALKKVQNLSVSKAREVLKALRTGESAKGTKKSSHDSDGDGEGEGENSGVSPDVVADKASMHLYLTGNAVAQLREALEQDVPDVKAALKIINALAKGNSSHEASMRKLCGDKVFESAMKATNAHMKERLKAA